MSPTDPRVNVRFTVTGAQEFADALGAMRDLVASLVPSQDAGDAETVPEDYDPTDAEMGGLAPSWAHSRQVVAQHPDYTDGLD